MKDRGLGGGVSEEGQGLGGGMREILLLVTMLGSASRNVNVRVYNPCKCDLTMETKSLKSVVAAVQSHNQWPQEPRPPRLRIRCRIESQASVPQQRVAHGSPPDRMHPRRRAHVSSFPRARSFAAVCQV